MCVFLLFESLSKSCHIHVKNGSVGTTESNRRKHAPIQAQTGRGNRRTVEAGHYVVLAAITSKLIGAPERGRQKSQREKRGRQKVSLTPRSPPHTRLSPVLPAEHLANVSAPKSQSQFKGDRETVLRVARQQRRWRECLGVKGCSLTAHTFGVYDSHRVCGLTAVPCVSGKAPGLDRGWTQHNTTLHNSHRRRLWKLFESRWKQSKIISSPSPVVVHNLIHWCNTTPDTSTVLNLLVWGSSA